MKLHPSLTCERIEEAVRRYNTTTDNPGFCTFCGQETGGVEPDATGYDCDHCGEQGVYGASELLFEVAT